MRSAMAAKVKTCPPMPGMNTTRGAPTAFGDKGTTSADDDDDDDDSSLASRLRASSRTVRANMSADNGTSRLRVSLKRRTTIAAFKECPP